MKAERGGGNKALVPPSRILFIPHLSPRFSLSALGENSREKRKRRAEGGKIREEERC